MCVCVTLCVSVCTTYSPLRHHCAGKDYTLLHAAPIVALFVLDHSGVPIPSPYEIEHKVVPPPDMHAPHFALICTQEQLKVSSKLS